MLLVDLNYNFEFDWFVELSDNKLSDNKLSDHKLSDNNLVRSELQVVLVNIACTRESRVMISHSYLFTVSRLKLISNVESNGIDMINICC